MLSEFLLFVVVLLLFAYYDTTRNYNHFSKRNVKSPRPAPFIGNGWPVFVGKHLVAIMNLVYDSFPTERYVGYYDYHNPCVWLRDNNIIKQVTTKDFESFLNHRPILNEKVDPLYSQLLICLRGKKWKEMRSIMTPAFTSSKIKAMMPLITECTQQMISFLKNEIDNKIKNGGDDVLEIETKDLFTRYANDVIASVGFGLKVDSLKDKDNEFYKMGEKLTDTNIKFFVTYVLNYLMPSVIEFFNISLIHKPTGEYFKKVVKHAMEERKKKGIKRLDMIHQLIEAEKGSLTGSETHLLPEDKYDLQYEKTEKTHWTDDELTAQALIFFLAGFESISTFLSFALYELATRQDIQMRLLEEVDSITDDENIYESIMSMKYMDMFVSECLRLYPTLPFADRECGKPCTLPPPNDESKQPYHMKQGDVITIPIRSIQRDSRFFSDPLKFDPERFSDENKKNIKPFTYIPFGAGPRQCLGRRFALTEVKCALYFILSQLTIVTCSKTKNPDGLPTKVVSMVPKQGIWVGLKKRN